MKKYEKYENMKNQNVVCKKLIKFKCKEDIYIIFQLRCLPEILYRIK